MKPQQMSMAIKGISRLEQRVGIKLPNISKNKIKDVIVDFCRALAILSTPNRWDYSLPSLFDEVWQLSILDTDYCAYICWYSVQKYGLKEERDNNETPFLISFDPDQKDAEECRQVFLKKFEEIYKVKMMDFPSAFNKKRKLASTDSAVSDASVRVAVPNPTPSNDRFSGSTATPIELSNHIPTLPRSVTSAQCLNISGWLADGQIVDLQISPAPNYTVNLIFGIISDVYNVDESDFKILVGGQEVSHGLLLFPANIPTGICVTVQPVTPPPVPVVQRIKISVILPSGIEIAYPTTTSTTIKAICDSIGGPCRLDLNELSVIFDDLFIATNSVQTIAELGIEDEDVLHLVKCEGGCDC